MVNWYFGWASILSAFVTGALIGLFFYREDFLGGYMSFSRRILRLGHIAQAALGMMNVLYSYSTNTSDIASVGFIVGGITMPAVCFLSSWRHEFRHLFFLPVTALSAAVIQTLWIGFR